MKWLRYAVSAAWKTAKPLSSMSAFAGVWALIGHPGVGSLTMRYEVREDDIRFELERDEPLKEGETFAQLTMIYKVRRVLPGNDEFDAIVEVERAGGPGRFDRLVPSGH